MNLRSDQHVLAVNEDTLSLSIVRVRGDAIDNLFVGVHDIS